MERKSDDSAVIAVGPAVIWAPEMRSIAHLCPADLHAAMEAHIEVRFDLSLLIPNNDERVIENFAYYVVARLRDL